MKLIKLLIFVMFLIVFSINVNPQGEHNTQLILYKYLSSDRISLTEPNQRVELVKGDRYTLQGTVTNVDWVGIYIDGVQDDEFTQDVETEGQNIWVYDFDFNIAKEYHVEVVGYVDDEQGYGVPVTETSFYLDVQEPTEYVHLNIYDNNNVRIFQLTEPNQEATLVKGNSYRIEGYGSQGVYSVEIYLRKESEGLNHAEAERPSITFIPTTTETHYVDLYGYIYGRAISTTYELLIQDVEPAVSTTKQPTPAEITLTDQGLERNGEQITEATPEAFGGCIERTELATSIENVLLNNPFLIGICEDTSGNKLTDTCVCQRNGEFTTNCNSIFTHYRKSGCTANQCSLQTPQPCLTENCQESCIPEPILIPQTIPSSCQLTIEGEPQTGVPTIDVTHYAQSDEVTVTASSSSEKVSPRVVGTNIYLDNILIEDESAIIEITINYPDGSYKVIRRTITGNQEEIDSALLSQLGFQEPGFVAKIARLFEF